MPNWCYNKIQFEDGEHLHEIKGILNKNPDKLLDFEDFGHKPDQRINFDYQFVEIDKNEINIYLLTGWSPPVAFLEHMSLMYPGTKITMQYCEASAEFAGESTFEAGMQNVVCLWSDDLLHNWHCDAFCDLPDDMQETLLEEFCDLDLDTKGMKVLMDKILNEDLSDFMYQYFGGPVGG